MTLTCSSVAEEREEGWFKIGAAVGTCCCWAAWPYPSYGVGVGVEAGVKSLQVAVCNTVPVQVQVRVRVQPQCRPASSQVRSSQGKSGGEDVRAKGKAASGLRR